MGKKKVDQDLSNEIVQERIKGENFDFTLRIGDIIDKNIEGLKLLNNRTLPVSYSEKFYEGVIERGPQFAKFVGNVTCRGEMKSGEKKLYILTLGILKPYRKLGIGKKLIEKVIEIAKEHSELKSIYLHVHIENEIAMKFYEKCGFEKGEYIENYYKDIENPHCFIYEKMLV